MPSLIWRILTLGLLGLLWNVVQPAIAVSQDMVLHSYTKKQAIPQKFFYYQDSTRALDIEQIVQLDKEGKFSDSKVIPPTNSYTHDIFWIRLDINNQSPQQWYLAPECYCTSLDTYRVVGGSPELIIKEGTVPYRFPINSLSIPQGESRIYLRAYSRSTPLSLAYVIYNQTSLEERKEFETILFALSAGCFIALIIYNLFLFISLKSKDYFFYLIFAATACLFSLLSVNFPNGIWHWFGIDWASIEVFYRPFAPFSTFLISRILLQVPQKYPKIDKLFLAYIAGLVILVVAAFFMPHSQHQEITDAYFSMGIIILTATAIYASKDNFQPARYYLAGLLIFLVSMSIYIARIEGFVPANSFTLNILVPGQAIEMILMSLSLAARIKILQAEKNRAEATAQVKGRLLRVISHDIANPLSVVKANAHILKRDITHPRVHSIARAAGIIEEILKFVHHSESLEREHAVELAPVSIQEVFDEMQFLFHDMAQEKGIHMLFDLQDKDLRAMAEPASFRYEVVGNFVTNAIKFSFPGSQIEIKAAQVSSKIVEVRVKDRGIGMSKEMLEKLFDPMENRSRPGTKGEKGGGFGMPLAKAYIDSYKATVEVKSVSIEDNADSCGTEFIIRLRTPPTQA